MRPQSKLRSVVRIDSHDLTSWFVFDLIWLFQQFNRRAALALRIKKILKIVDAWPWELVLGIISFRIEAVIRDKKEDLSFFWKVSLVDGKIIESQRT